MTSENIAVSSNLVIFKERVTPSAILVLQHRFFFVRVGFRVEGIFLVESAQVSQVRSRIYFRVKMTQKSFSTTEVRTP